MTTKYDSVISKCCHITTCCSQISSSRVVTLMPSVIEGDSSHRHMKASMDAYGFRVDGVDAVWRTGGQMEGGRIGSGRERN